MSPGLRFARAPLPPQRPQVILLRDGTDTSQGVGQLISNINACQAVVETVRTTLGPRGMDKLIHSGNSVRVRCVQAQQGVCRAFAPPPPPAAPVTPPTRAASVRAGAFL